jgi:hypothetical protein
MPSSYPGGLDSFTNPTGTDNLDTAVGGLTHSAQHGAVNDAIEAIEGELGTNPSGAALTVAARFTAVEADVAAVETDLTTLEATVAGLPGAETYVFDVVAYGAEVDGTTNDTAAWQAALDAAGAAGGGIVTSSKPGVSVISGALQDTSNANAQLLLPDVHMLDDAQIGITIRGPYEQSSVCSVVGATPAPTSGLVIKSTLASGSGAVFGAYGSGTSYLNFTFVHLRMENVTVRTVACTLENVIVDTGQYDTTLTEPTTATSFGIRLPKNNNGAHIRLRNVATYGFYNGIEFSEHAEFDSVSVGATNTALIATAANHASRFSRVLIGYSKYGLRFTGAHALDIDQYDVEHAASGWYQTTYDVDDASNYGKGLIRWHAVLQGVGDHNSFVVNGASGRDPRCQHAAGVEERHDPVAGHRLLRCGQRPHVRVGPVRWRHHRGKVREHVEFRVRVGAVVGWREHPRQLHASGLHEQPRHDLHRLKGLVAARRHLGHHGQQGVHVERCRRSGLLRRG